MRSGKRALNRLLKRAIGYQLISTAHLEKVEGETRRNAKVREQNEAARQKNKALRDDLALRAERVRARQRQNAALVSRLETQVRRIEGLTKPKPAPKPSTQMPPDYDPIMESLWPLVKDRTMTGAQKTNTLVEAVRYIERCKIPGAVVECGVWRGGAMLTIAEMLVRLRGTDRDLYLFDTYAGMTPPTDRDVHIHKKIPADQLLAGKVGVARIWEPASLEDVQAGFDNVPYPEDKLHFVVGKVEDTVPEHAPDQIALLRLDTDWYESTKHELEHLYSRLVPGGILIIDDYGSWQGSKDATDEWLATTGEPLMLVRMELGRVAVKPGLQSRVAHARPESVGVALKLASGT